MAERCFLRRASPASIATREMRLLCTAIGTRIASLRMAASCDAKSSRQVDIAVLPSPPVPERVRGRRSVHVVEVSEELKQQSPHAPPVPLFANALPSRRGERWRAETLTHGDVSCSAGSQRANRAALSR